MWQSPSQGERPSEGSSVLRRGRGQLARAATSARVDRGGHVLLVLPLSPAPGVQALAFGGARLDPHSSLSVPLTLPAWTTQTSSREIGAGEIRTDAALWSSIHSWSPVPREGLVPGEHSAHCFLNQRVETEVHSKGALSSARQAASSSRFSILTTRRGQEQYAHIQAAPRRRLGHRWQGGQGWGRGATDDLRGHWKLKPLCNQDRTRRAVLQVSSCFLVATDLHYLSRRLLGAPTPRANCCWQSAAHAPSSRLHSRWESGGPPCPALQGDCRWPRPGAAPAAHPAAAWVLGHQLDALRPGCRVLKLIFNKTMT